MERLIEKMMVDLNADSDEESAYTLTDVTSLRSEKSELSAASDQDTVVQNTSLSKITVSNTSEKNNDESVSFTPSGNAICSTPEKTENTYEKEKKLEQKKDKFEPKKDNTRPKQENSDLKKETLDTKKEHTNSNKVNLDSKKGNLESYKDNIELNKDDTELKKDNTELKKDNTELKKDNTESKQQANEITLEENNENSAYSPTLKLKQESLNFIENERSTQKLHRTPKNEKIANGRTVKSVPSKKKGNQTERREHTAIPARIPSENKSF